VHRAPLQMSVVSNHAPVAHQGVPFVGAVDDGAVLDGGPCPDADRPMIAAENGCRPDRGFGADVHVADHHGIGMDEGGGVDGGCEVTECIQGHDPSLARGFPRGYPEGRIGGSWGTICAQDDPNREGWLHGDRL
jgi:hypothetical protein